MRFKTKWEKIMITATVVVGIVMIGGNSSKAALQANQTTHARKKAATGARWIEEIRKMETAGQTMGLTETLNGDLSPKTSNNIDVHMMRTTEYGAIAILSASGFGNSKKLSEVSIKSTTGNVTGVYMGDREEWTAGTSRVSSSTTLGKNSRYYDLYTTDNTSAKIGDALGSATSPNPGCAGWHGASKQNWTSLSERSFSRGFNGIFSFDGGGSNYNSSSSTYADWSKNSYCGRGVAVVKSGV